MQLSKVTYALVAAGLVGGVATFYNQLDSSPVANAFAAGACTLWRRKAARTKRDGGV